MKNILTAAVVATLAGIALPGVAHEEGDLLIRGGIGTVAPDASSDAISIPTNPPIVLPGGVDVDNDTQLSLTVSYMFHDKFGIEVLAATPFEHDITLEDAPVKVGSTKHLPPTVSLQWYPRGGMPGWQPYLGLGVNYTAFFDEQTTAGFEDALGDLVGAGGPVDTKLELEDSIGLAAQVGVDVPLGEHWFLNAGIWYIDIGTEATVRTALPDVRFDVDIDPWVYNFSIGYRF